MIDNKPIVADDNYIGQALKNLYMTSLGDRAQVYALIAIAVELQKLNKSKEPQEFREWSIT